MSVYAVSDLHGCLDAYKKIKEFIKPEDKVYVLGDCGDRGPQPWETIKAILTDPQMIVLKGNHEDMLVKAAREALSPDFLQDCYHQRILVHNGGMWTLENLLGQENVETWIKHIQSLPTHLEYTNKNKQKFFLCHAGCTHGMSETLPETEDLLWDRLHYLDNPKFCDEVIVVHGHTWVRFIKEELKLDDVETSENKILHYSNNKKICLDLGTYHTGDVGLLNLDDFSETYFKI